MTTAVCFAMEEYRNTPVAQLSDEILLNQVASGDQNALEILYDRYAARVLGIALKVIAERSIAEEILQETFWWVWQHAVRFQSQRGSFQSWLFQIARNLAIDAYRRRSVRPQIIDQRSDVEPLLDQVPDEQMGVPEQAESNLVTEQVQKALKSLPPEQRQVIVLAYFCGMTRQEIAETTGEMVGTIHTRARLGLQKLQRRMKEAE